MVIAILTIYQIRQASPNIPKPPVSKEVSVFVCNVWWTLVDDILNLLRDEDMQRFNTLAQSNL